MTRTIIRKSQAPAASWTIAWRKRTANHFRRANNWAGTWAEAFEMARAFGELHPEYQVYYTTTAAYEQWERDEIAAGTLAADRGEDHGNIMVDSGKRIRVRDTGVVEADLLDADIAKVAAEVHETSYVRKNGITSQNPRSRGQWYTSPAKCREWARGVRASYPEIFASMVTDSRTADERFAAGAN
ncbi:MAG TPA: hypothetical protein VF516_18765 [Kofleriaceae bacterium]